MLTIKENGVYPVSGTRYGGIALVTQIVNNHVFGRVLIRDKENGDFYQREFHSEIFTEDNHQFFPIWNGWNSEEGERVVVEACDCVTNINRNDNVKYYYSV